MYRSRLVFRSHRRACVARRLPAALASKWALSDSRCRVCFQRRRRFPGNDGKRDVSCLAVEAHSGAKLPQIRLLVLRLNWSSPNESVRGYPAARLRCFRFFRPNYDCFLYLVFVFFTLAFYLFVLRRFVLATFFITCAGKKTERKTIFNGLISPAVPLYQGLATYFADTSCLVVSRWSGDA